MALSREIAVVEEEGTARELYPQVLSGMSSTLERGGRKVPDHLGEAIFRRKFIALIDVAKDWTILEENTSHAVSQLESPFPLYEFL